MKPSRKFLLSGLFSMLLLICGVCRAEGGNLPVATSQDRFLAIGFDDLRPSDLSTVWPILGQYDDFHATFNRISETLEGDANVEFLQDMGQEIGDHTWFHQAYIFTDPLLNGQNPAAPEGSQVPYPSNDQMRLDRGDGKNAFGYDLSAPVGEVMSKSGQENLSALKTPWGKLTDKQCQQLRELYSVMKDQTGLLAALDLLSNTYLGTEGSSAGSWDEARGCYTGGIFTGCRTSANHEIWERILEATRLHFREVFLRAPVTWSMPGGDRSCFFFERDGKRYYDEDCTLLYNYLAPMPSSLYTDLSGAPKRRSWVQALREAGYRIAHDAMYPSRLDGTEPTMMSRQLIFNAFLSRRDALAYPTNRSASYLAMAEDYPESFFDPASAKTAAEQMYDGGGAFRSFIEAIRLNTSNGMVHGEVIDSSDSFSFRQYLTAVMDYCQATGVRVVSKREAFDICFEEDRTAGDNLIYNQQLINTAKIFLPGAEMVPANPDGYQGDCSVLQVEKQPALRVEGTAWYLHFGIPLGAVSFSAQAKGTGTVRIYAIRNADAEVNAARRTAAGLRLLAEGKVESDAFTPLALSFTVPQAEETAFEQQWEGMGEKIMGIRIEYEGDLTLRDLALFQVK